MPLTLTRSLLTILLPGAVAVAPWILVLLLTEASVAAYYTSFAAAFNVAAFAAATIVGTVFEGWGTYLENVWDGELGARDAPSNEDWVHKDWFDYLSVRCGDNEPVAFRYFGRKVTGLYFELGMFFASIAAVVGFAYLFYRVGYFGAVCLVVVVGWAIPVLFLRSAKDTHKTICQSRCRVMTRLRASG